MKEWSCFATWLSSLADVPRASDHAGGSTSRKRAPCVIASRARSAYSGTATGSESRGAYCWAPKMSGSPGLPLGRSR